MSATNKMCRNLNILMWKHLMVRKRKFISAILELISPISLILLMFMIKDLLAPSPQAVKEMGVVTAETEPFALPRSVIPDRIYYTPNTLLVGDLMDAVGDKLLRSRLDSLPDRRSKGFYALPSDTDIEKLLSEIEDKDAIVIFQDMSLATRWPKKLNYTIRMNVDFMTHIYNSLNEIVEPHEQFGAIYEPFMALQLAIDTSYIKMLTNEDVNQTVMFQDFPFTTSLEAATIDIICKLLAIFCSLSLLLPFVFLMSHLLSERATGQEELVKMAGVSTNTLGVSHFLNALPAGLIYTIVTTILLKVPPSTALIPHTDPLLIFLMLLLHFISIISVAFVCSYLTQSSEHSTSIAVFAYAALWFSSSWLSGKVKSKPLILLTGLLPHVPNDWFWSQVAAAEQAGKGVQFSSVERNFSSAHGSPLMCYLFFILQSIIFFSLSWYLSKVRPGKYGHAKPWNFLCNKRKVKPDMESDDDDAHEQMVQDSVYFESPPKHLNAGIKIINVTKVYPRNRVLNNLSLEIYKGEITVLLGHNGAGKTTLMSIITGMKSATEGAVYVNGVDSRSARAALKQQIGYCPQENLFFTDLTVLEHVMFFALLKGATFSEARNSSFNLLTELGIRDKANDMGHSLSGGMKRRLQLACALAGGSSVLILDEPTSGLDVETRRELWDLLLSLRGDRTVVVSTHFMEEADALGDRVAALQGGALVCHATPMHLKKAIDTGYRLSFTTVAAPRITDISEIVTSHVPGASVSGQTFNSVTYSLPAKSSDKFPALFSKLETNRSELGIESIGVGVSTLEEVFLKLCSDKRTPNPLDEVDAEQTPEPTFIMETGPLLYFRQFLVLIRRQIKFIWSKKILFLTLNVLLPILLILSITRTSSDYGNEGIPQNVPKSMSLGLYSDMPDKRAFYFDNSSGIGMRAVRDRHPDVQFEYTEDVAKAVLETARKDKIEYNKYLVGIELSDTSAKVLYTTTVRHAAPVALNLLTNMLAANSLPDSDGRTITTYNHPHQRVVVSKLVEPKSIVTAVLWALIVSFIIQNVLLSHISLPSQERVSGARHIHLMSGCPATLHWLTTLLFHTTFSVVTLAVPTVIIAAVADPDRTLGDPGALGAIFVIITLGCMAVLSFIYLCSFKLSEKGADSALLFIIGFVFSIITASIALGSDIHNSNESFESKLARSCKYIFPHQAFTEGLASTVLVARLNGYCTLNKDKCPDLILPVKNVDSEHCCATGSGNSCYFCTDDTAPGKEILILFIQIIVYMSIVILTQRGFFGGLWNRIISRRYTADRLYCNEPLVRDEKAYVEKTIELPEKQINDAMLAHDLHKRYVGVLKKTCNAVKGVSFSVKKGECFGLLGVNGAGKSTTFKMLVCEDSPTRGRLYANQHFREINKWQYMHSLGYCPQFFGMDNFQTGKENLAMLLTLRGFSAAHVSSEVRAWIQVVGLEQYANRAVSSYSGGCVRRLGTAAALCVGAPVTLLDEPTSGVDVAARRNVWAALRRGLRQWRSVVITSHSMDEMEALCNRIAIMSKGETCALGSPAALRAAYAAGHALILKLASRDETDGSTSELDRLKGDLYEKFNGKLDREHKTMLHYHISEAMSYSELFTRLEQLKSTYSSLIEDYAITETTLEEVFLSFAKDGAATDTTQSPVAQV